MPLASASKMAMVRDSSNGCGKSGPGSNALSKLSLSVSSAIYSCLRNCHRRTQALQRPIDPRLDPRHRDAESDRHIAQWHVEVKVHEDRDSLVIGQAHHGATKVLPLKPARLVDRRRCVRVGKSNQMPPSTPTDFSALVGDDAHEPWLEGAPLTQVS